MFQINDLERFELSSLSTGHDVMVAMQRLVFVLHSPDKYISTFSWISGGASLAHY